MASIRTGSRAARSICFGHLCRAVHRLWCRAAAGRDERRAIARLRGFSDSQLKDIGISRSDIVSAVRHGRPIRR